MKHYTTIFCCLVLSAVLIFVPAAHAASANITSFVANSIRLDLVDSYIPQYDSTDNPIGDYALYHYQGTFDISAQINSVDSYLNGMFKTQVNFSVSTPAGLSNYTLNLSTGNFISNESIFTSGARGRSINSSLVAATAFFDNYFSRNSGLITLCTVTADVTYTKPITGSNLPDPPQYISALVTSSDTNNVLITTSPSEEGLTGVITEAIINGINDQSLPFDDILSVLESIRTQDQTNYTTIVAYLADNDTFNSTLYTWLTTVLEDNFTDLLDDTTYISSVLNAARNLINSMNNRDTLYYPIFESALDVANTRLQTLINLMSETPAEAASMENAIIQMESKQAAINDYTLPAAGNIMGNANSYVRQGTAGMNLLATILNQPLYILILMTVISLAFVSYLLYGKGV